MINPNLNISQSSQQENIENDITRFIAAVHGGNPFEVRLLGTPRGIISGYFDNAESLEKQIKSWDGSGKGIFVTMNTLSPKAQERVKNTLDYHVKTTTQDDDIIEYNWIPIDIDPVRPSDTSSTKDELTAALNKASAIKNTLGKLGWPQPIELMSGNGAHLLYKISLDNNISNRDVVRKVLEWLDNEYSDETVNVDTSVFNPSRIIKLSGTHVCKGWNSQERPHRVAAVINIPEDIKMVPLEKLYDLANQSEATKYSALANKKNSEFKTLEGFKSWLAENDIAVHNEKSYKDGTLLVLEDCPFNDEHTNYSSYLIWFPNGYIVAGCHHNSCQDKDYYAFRKSIDSDWEPFGNSKDTKGDKAFKIVTESKLILSQLKEPFAILNINGHLENHPLESTFYKDWLCHEYYTRYGSMAGTDVIKQIIPIARSIARLEGSEREMNVRVGQAGDAFYYDLVNETWQVVKITPEGWELTTPQDVYFRRYAFTGKQCTPEKGPNGIQKFLDFTNLKNEDEKQLLLVYLVCCLIPDMPKVIAIFHGEKGSSKSTTMRLIRKLIDPSVEELLNLPYEDRSVVLSLNNNYMPAFDNLDVIKDRHSDFLCRVCTGGAFSFRKFFTDSDEVIFKLKRCIMLNGINLVADKTDLIDRSITFELDRISEDKRREEKELYEEFERVKPQILADMFDILSKAMKLYPEVNLAIKSRMADWERWGYAVAEAMGIGGESFVAIYNKNRSKGNEQIVNTNPLTAAVMTHMQLLDTWRGTLSDFHNEIDIIADREHLEKFNRHWPKAANKVVDKLKLVKSNLLEAGVDYTIMVGKEGDYKNRKIIEIKKNNNSSVDAKEVMITTDDKNETSFILEQMVVNAKPVGEELSFNDIP